jgi:hypothetical protein
LNTDKLFLHIRRRIKEREEKLVKYFHDIDIIQSLITDNTGAHVFIYPTFAFFEIGAITKLHPRSVIGPHSLVKEYARDVHNRLFNASFEDEFTFLEENSRNMGQMFK